MLLHYLWALLTLFTVSSYGKKHNILQRNCGISKTSHCLPKPQTLVSEDGYTEYMAMIKKNKQDICSQTYGDQCQMLNYEYQKCEPSGFKVNCRCCEKSAASQCQSLEIRSNNDNAQFNAINGIYEIDYSKQNYGYNCYKKKIVGVDDKAYTLKYRIRHNKITWTIYDDKKKKVAVNIGNDLLQCDSNKLATGDCANKQFHYVHATCKRLTKDDDKCMPFNVGGKPFNIAGNTNPEFLSDFRGQYAVCDADQRDCKPGGLGQHKKCKPLKSCCSNNGICSNHCKCENCIDFNNINGYCSYDSLLKKTFIGCGKFYLQEFKKKNVGKWIYSAINSLIIAPAQIGLSIASVSPRTEDKIAINAAKAAVGLFQSALNQLYILQYGDDRHPYTKDPNNIIKDINKQINKLADCILNEHLRDNQFLNNKMDEISQIVDEITYCAALKEDEFDQCTHILYMKLLGMISSINNKHQLSAEAKIALLPIVREIANIFSAVVFARFHVLTYKFLTIAMAHNLHEIKLIHAPYCNVEAVKNNAILTLDTIDNLYRRIRNKLNHQIYFNNKVTNFKCKIIEREDPPKASFSTIKKFFNSPALIIRKKLVGKKKHLIRMHQRVEVTTNYKNYIQIKINYFNGKKPCVYQLVGNWIKTRVGVMRPSKISKQTVICKIARKIVNWQQAQISKNYEEDWKSTLETGYRKYVKDTKIKVQQFHLPLQYEVSCDGSHDTLKNPRSS
eukprot:418271_1